MCSLARTVAPSSIAKEGRMQDGGGGCRMVGRRRAPRDWECFEIPMGRNIWLQNRLTNSDCFGKTEICVALFRRGRKEVHSQMEADLRDSAATISRSQQRVGTQQSY